MARSTKSKVPDRNHRYSWVPKEKAGTNLGRSRVLQIPKFDISHSNSDKVLSIFGERYGLYFGRDFVAGDFDVVLPVPDVDYHVMLGPDGHNVLIIRRKCLKERKEQTFSLENEHSY